MNDDDRRKMENQLIVMGLKNLTDPELVQQMARLITDGGFLAGLLNECPQEKRSEMYYALKPYLPFKPLSLDHYMDFFRRRADAIDSAYSPVVIRDDAFAAAPVFDENPVIIGGNKFQEVAAGDAEACVLKLTCYKCTKSEEFMGLTPVEAVTVARNMGWVRDLTMQKEICPKCPAVRARVN